MLMHKLGIVAIILCALIDYSIAEPRVVCYYTNWSVYRPGTAKFNPQNINPYLCTHLIYAFGGFTKDNQLKPFDKYQDIEQGGYAKFTGLKTYNKELKTMLAIGGWNEGSTRFSPLVASSERRSKLIKNAIKFLRQNKFDGLDLDWEYPAFRDGGKARDRDNYAKLVQELREEFQREHDKTGRPRLLLTMAVPAGLEYIDKGYDVPKLNKHLDWFNLLSYDYHSAYEPSVNHHAPLYPIEEENEYSYDTDLNINSTINYYLKAGASRDKLVLGIPTYGRSYTLFNAESNEIGAPADGPGDQGDATREKGYLAYYEICQSINEEDSQWTVVQPNPDALGPYAYNDNQWVGYDDEEIVRKKSKFVVEQNLGGIMFWSIDNDDFRGLCNGKPYPLIEAAKEAYFDGISNGVPTRNTISSGRKQVKVATTTTKRPDSRSKSGGKFTTPPPPTTPDPGSDFKCEDEGFYAHPRDCKKYFWCLEAAGLGIVAHQFTCPSGLYFNKAADSCDYTRNVLCSKTTTTKTTTTTTEEPVTRTTTTRAAAVSTRTNPLYRSPSRTTQRTTTTTEYVEPITEQPELDQEDPRVIKELIDLIKKVGGVEELEKQLNLHEEGGTVTLSSKSDSRVTTSSPISKSLYDKIKNRASVLKTKPAFNGASQPERVLERTEVKERSTTSTTEASLVSRKYQTVNRFSRPGPQSSGIESLPESDAVLIEKPQYTVISRRKPAKPAVVVENDYNGDSESSSVEDIKKSAEKSEKFSGKQKYASISRLRRPQVQVIDDENDSDEEEEEEEDIFPLRSSVTQQSTTSRSTSKYVNLSRRRSTTSAPDVERIDDAEEETTTTTTTPSRRRLSESTPTQKTVLSVNINRNKIQSNIQDNIDTIKTLEKEILTGNKNTLDDDDNFDNIIALPTEPVTDNVPFPENIFTTGTPSSTTPPTTTPQSIQVTESANQSESLNDILDDGSNEIDPETTTLIIDLGIIDSGKSNLIDILSFREKSNSLAPRPFSRPSFTRTRPTVSSRNEFSTSTKSSTTTQEPTSKSTRSIRRRPTRQFTTVADTDNDLESTTRGHYTYRPGYRGTARFRPSTTRSGEYEYKDNLPFNSYDPIENNRLRSLSYDRASKRPKASTESSDNPTTEGSTRRRLNTSRRSFTSAANNPTRNEENQTVEPSSTTEGTTRRRLITSRRFFSSTTNNPISNEEEEQTTEQRIVEAKNYFNLEKGERPERIRFELAVGRKIDFGFKPTKIENKTSENDSSKVTVITGPLNKSPLVSSRDYRQGHVEEIPLTNIEKTETVTVQSFSDKLDLSEIPLNKSDIESFVRDEDLRTDSLAETTTRKARLRPSKIGFLKRSQVVSESIEDVVEETTSNAIDNNSKQESTTSRLRFRPSRIGFAQRTQTESTSTETQTQTSQVADNEPTSRFSFRPGQTRFPARVKVINKEASNEDIDDERIEEPSTRRSRPLPSRSRATLRSRTTTTESENSLENIETSTSRKRPSGFRRRYSQQTQVEANKLDDSKTEESTTSKLQIRRLIPNRFAQQSKIKEVKIEDVNELQTEGPIDETTLRRLRLRPNDSRRYDTYSNSLEVSDDDNTDENDNNDLESLDLVTEKEIEDDGIDFTTLSSLTKPNEEDKSDENEDEPKDESESVDEKEDESEDEDETTLDSIADDTTSTTRRTLKIRKRPLKKIEVLATRQTITEATDEDLNDDNEEVLTTTTESVLRTRPTRRRLVTRRRIANENRFDTSNNFLQSQSQTESQSQSEVEEESIEVTSGASVQSRPTRKRVIFTRTRPKINSEIESEDQGIERISIPLNNEGNEETIEETSEKLIDSVNFRRIKVFRTRPTTGRIADSDSDSIALPRNPSPRTRVFKRPIPTIEAENSESEIDEESSSVRPRFGSGQRKAENSESEIESRVDEESSSVRPRFGSGSRKAENSESEIESKVDEESSSVRPRFGSGQKRRIIKVNRKAISSESDDDPREEVATSSTRPSTKKRIYKVLRTKAPKLLIDRPLIDERPIIRSEDRNQLLEKPENVQDENFNDNNNNDDNGDNDDDDDDDGGIGDENPEEPSRPILRYPTRPNSNINRVVTIKRRPAFNLNTRSTTLHPASTRFSKDALPTRAKQVTVRRKFKPTVVSSDTTVEEIDQEKRIALGERNKKIFSKGYRKSLTTTTAPNITPFSTNENTETTEFDDVVDTTDIPLDNNDENVLQKDVTSTKPRFSLSRFTTTTTTRPTTLHHVFAIDIEDEEDSSKNKTEIKENNADEVIKKLQKLIEINRIVEVYSKEEKLKLLKNKKLKSIKLSELTVEKPPVIDKFGEISRETIIKLVKSNYTTTTEAAAPAVNETRSPKNIVFAETIFPEPEISTITLEGLFEREKKSYDVDTDKIEENLPEKSYVSSSVLRAPIPLLRPESNETDPIIISLKSLDKVILSKVQQRQKEDNEENSVTDNPSEETTVLDEIIKY